jgi:hypothetical protein
MQVQLRKPEEQDRACDRILRACVIYVDISYNMYIMGVLIAVAVLLDPKLSGAISLM